MTITKLSAAAVERFADGREFGTAGAYERVYGIACGELDPAAPENAIIVDLDKAERNPRGMVEYEIDFFILRPAEPRRGNGVLVYDVTNRGRKVILGRLDEAAADADTNDPKPPATLVSASPSGADTPSSGRGGTRTRRVPTTA